MKTSKAKRQLTNITFDHDNAHLALCSKEQGSANNRNSAVLLKAYNLNEELINKMQQVKVTLELPDFLQRFFGLWGNDAKVLATMMGYKEPVETVQMENNEAQSEMQSWLEERLSAFEIIKASKDLDLTAYLSGLEAQDIVAMLQDQMLIEKATNCFDEEYIAQVKEELLKASTVHPDPQGESSIASEGKEGKNPVIKKKKKETNMDENQIKELQKAAEQLKDVLKANEDMKVELQKANDAVAVFKAEKQAAILKAKVDAVAAVVPNKEHAEVLVKAAVLIQDEAEFSKYVETLKAIHVAVEKNDLFIEKGASGGSDDSSVTVEKLLKAKFQAK
jgi:hypothetical protein